MLDPALTLPLALLIHHTSPVLHIAFLNTPLESKSSRVWGGGKIAPLIPRLLNIHPLVVVVGDSAASIGTSSGIFSIRNAPSTPTFKIHTDLILNSKYPIIQILRTRPAEESYENHKMNLFSHIV